MTVHRKGEDTPTTIRDVDVRYVGRSAVELTVTDERGRRRTFELTRPLADHLQWLLSVKHPLAADQLLPPDEIAEQAGRGKG